MWLYDHDHSNFPGCYWSDFCYNASGASARNMFKQSLFFFPRGILIARHLWQPLFAYAYRQ
jgi:hypothetical protein